ncbi:MAG: PEGA domain-containing protein [Phycisphaeraceae bacterium]|nr:MAG: PEGA domain-containing protein [Phycisphaeraceae bacterium]
MTRAGLIVVSAGCLVALGACAQRRIEITSQPPGATVWVNDLEVGRTPVTATFVHYGTYDVRLAREGCEPLSTSARAAAPWYEYVGPDLVAEAWPGGVTTTVRWHFTLEPAREVSQDRGAFEAGLIERAGALRSRLAVPHAGGE